MNTVENTQNTSISSSSSSQENVQETQSTVSARWNPTKEQIAILESLYRQGLRTPSAQQIQQITAQLRMYGHIEGKNVFYWFQNHKARQRQKEKQEKLLCVNQFIPPPAFAVLPSNCTNIVSAPYHLSQASPRNGLSTSQEPAFTQERHMISSNVMLTTEKPWAFNYSSSVKNDCSVIENPSSEFVTDKEHIAPEASYIHPQGNTKISAADGQDGLYDMSLEYTRNELETLDLFPLHPDVDCTSNGNGKDRNEYAGKLIRAWEFQNPGNTLLEVNQNQHDENPSSPGYLNKPFNFFPQHPCK